MSKIEELRQAEKELNEAVLEHFVRARDAAEMLGIKFSSLMTYEKRRGVPIVRVLGAPLVSKYWLEDFIKGGKKWSKI